MRIGSYFIDNYGMKTCLKCCHRTWSNEHNCWEPNGRFSGRYISVTVPELVATVAAILRENWQDSKTLYEET